MPRHHRAPKTYNRCEWCGALFPAKYGCTCNETQVFRRIRELFPDVVIESVTAESGTTESADGTNGASEAT